MEAGGSDGDDEDAVAGVRDEPQPVAAAVRMTTAAERRKAVEQITERPPSVRLTANAGSMPGRMQPSQAKTRRRGAQCYRCAGSAARCSSCPSRAAAFAAAAA